MVADATEAVSFALDGSSAARLTPTHPWPGLASFSEADRAFFRGREREADELARLVRRESLTVLFGRSGLGKTSLLSAGLFPRLREDLYLPVFIRLAHGAKLSLREQVWQALANTCRASRVDATAPVPHESLWEHFHLAKGGFWNARNRALTPVLVFDQFEELFTLGQADDETRLRAAQLVSELSDLIEDRPPEALRQALDSDPELAERIDFRRRGCKVVLSFREDFLAEMESLRVPSLMRNRYRLLPMNGHQARDVIDSGGALVGADVAHRIIGLAWRNRAEAPSADDYDRMEVDPALLSVICSELNLRRIAAGSDHIGAELLAGAEREILVDFYDRSLNDLDPRVRIFVEDELITEAGHRDSHALDDALALPGVTLAAIEQLVSGRLLAVDDRFGVRRLELAHDVLTRVVKDSRDARQAREAQSAAAAREREALAMQRRNRRHAVWIGLGGLLAAALMVGAALSAREAVRATRAEEQARADSAAARQEAEAATAKSRQMVASAAEANQRVEQAKDESRLIAKIAAAGEEHASEAAAKAADLTRDALATNLIANARASAESSRADRGLLLGAEASLRYPERLDAQLAQLARLIANEGVHKQLSIEGIMVQSAVSPDGRRMAMGTDRGEVIDLDLSSWTVLRRWKSHDGPVRILAYDLSGSRLVSANDKTVVAWQLLGDHEVRELGHSPRDSRSDYAALTVSPGGNFVALVYRGGQVDLWPLPSQHGSAPMRRLDAHRGLNSPCVGFDQDESTLVVGDKDGLAVASLAAGSEVVMTPMGNAALARTRDCRLAATRGVGPDGKPVIDLRESLSGNVVGTLWDAPGGDPSVVFEPGGRFVTLRSAQSTAVWATQPLKQLSLLTQDLRWATALAVSPDGRWLATASTGGQVTVGPSAGGPVRLKFTASPTVVFQFAPDSNSVYAFTRGAASSRTVWSLAPGGVLRSGDAPYSAYEAEFNRTGSVLATGTEGGPDGGSAHFWNAMNGADLRRETHFHTTEFSPNGSRLAIERDGAIDVVDMVGDGHAILHLPKPSQAEVERYALSWDNKRLAVTHSDGSIHVYEMPPSTRETVLPGQRGSKAVAFSPNGQALAVAGDDGVVRLYRFGSQAAAAIALPDPHDGPVWRLAFSPDGRRLASGGDDRMAVLRDVSSGQTLARFGPSEGLVDRLVFIGGGEALISGVAMGARDVWDIQKGSLIARLRDTGGTVKSVDVSPSGRRVAVLHYDNSLSLRSWDGNAMWKDACQVANRNLDCAEWRQFMPDVPYQKTCPGLPAPQPACH